MRQTETEEVILQRVGTCGVITLNRPQALNALNLSMIRSMYQALDAWRGDDSVEAVIVEGAGEKAFCAGGDVRAVYDAHKAGHITTTGDTFFREEYTLNHLIRTYPKPYIALIHGIAMGGGLGVSIHGSIRVVSETTSLAMPETGLGLFTDVGGTEFLGRAGSVGLYLGLTGARFDGADALYAGIATHFVALSNFISLRENLSTGENPDHVLSRFSSVPAPGFLETHRIWIDEHFSKKSVEDILKSLAQDSHELSQKTYAQLMTKSPTSLKVVFEQLRGYDTSWSFADIMKREFRLSQHFMQGHDFFEGVRALLVDKDRNPQWVPDSLEEVGDVRGYFSELGERELIV